MNDLLNFARFLKRFNLSGRHLEILNGFLVAFVVLIVAVVSFYITKYTISYVVKKIIAKSKNDYDDIFVKKKVFDSLSHIVPAIIFFIGLKYITTDLNLILLLKKLIYSYLILSSLVLVFRLLNSFNAIYEIYAHRKNLSIQIKQYLQVLKIIFALATLIFILSIILNQKPGSLLAGLGAMTAILLLIFKDSIMSLVASVQISAYNLVKVGDWISIPAKDIDGDIMDISLNSIKIRNFDKTISTIPTYSIVQDSFINWRGMELSGGRRIKRAINIDVQSIKLCDSEMIEKFKKIDLIKNYVIATQQKLDKWNKKNDIKEPVSINGKAQTNIGIFRKYIENYLIANFRVFKKYQKEKFEIEDKLFEYFVIDDPEFFISNLGSQADFFLEKIKGKTVIRNLEKFLTIYSDKYLLENNYLYKVNKIVEEVFVNSVRVEKIRFQKEEIKIGSFCDDLGLLVRQLPITDRGLPVEIYVFASTTIWSDYENIQSDLFDHIFAVLKEFELKIYQQPSSADFSQFLSLAK